MRTFRSIDKDYLRAHQREILERGGLSPRMVDRILSGGISDDPRVVVQISSGSTGEPLLIPRSPADIVDIARRMMQPFIERVGRVPARVAMIGGISHSQAAMKTNLGASELRSFDADELQAIVDFDPVVVSCYPSVVRGLLQSLPDSLPALSAIKLGGERIFQADLNKIFARFPGVFVIEQLGSTELPALAVRVHEAPADGVASAPPPYELQTRRFRFQLDETRDGWQALIARDDFEDLLFPVNEFYETGDEVLLGGGRVLEVRRTGDRARDFYEAAESLLAAPSCVNVQFRPGDASFVCDGEPDRTTVPVEGREFRRVRGMPRRIETSNKLPLVVD